ncbi:hypothetical protein Ddye_012957 [Dipteronia dyeriana]|uniref:Transposase MuDR plant domain-containing protein n=1 Tax=Dipteronia dyeriana TaxID=168575 RepID=A0AAD9X587_9ROSI|nr:hypothetical protein Ddye_012957 [Dipteronia dyeriana]
MFKDKKILKEVLGIHALTLRFEYKVGRSDHLRFVATCKKRYCQLVFRVRKSRNGTYWHVTSVDSEHTYGDNGNYNIDFHCVSSHFTEVLFSRNFVDTGCNIYPKDILFNMKDKHDINLSYNKAYRVKFMF